LVTLLGCVGTHKHKRVSGEAATIGDLRPVTALISFVCVVVMVQCGWVHLDLDRMCVDSGSEKILSMGTLVQI